MNNKKLYISLIYDYEKVNEKYKISCFIKRNNSSDDIYSLLEMEEIYNHLIQIKI